MYILLHLAGWPMIGLSVLGFFGADTVIHQIIAAIVFVAGWICVGSAVIAGALDEIREGHERQRTREWNLGVALLDQLRHPHLPQATPSPDETKLREPITSTPPTTSP